MYRSYFYMRLELIIQLCPSSSALLSEGSLQRRMDKLDKDA